MSISSIKGYFERDSGQVIIKDIPTLKQLRGLGAIGTTTTSASIFPLERLVSALALAKGPKKELVMKIASLRLPEKSEEG